MTAVKRGADVAPAEEREPGRMYRSDQNGGVVAVPLAEQRHNEAVERRRRHMNDADHICRPFNGRPRRIAFRPPVDPFEDPDIDRLEHEATPCSTCGRPDRGLICRLKQCSELEFYSTLTDQQLTKAKKAAFWRRR